MPRTRGDRRSLRAMAEERDPLSGAVIGAAIYIHGKLGPSLLESAYEECLAIVLARRGLACRRQCVLPIVFEGHRVDAAYRIDLIVEDRLIVELKTVDRVLPVHRAQLRTYLRLSGRHVGLLLNFRVAMMKDGITRIVMTPGLAGVGRAMHHSRMPSDRDIVTSRVVSATPEEIVAAFRDPARLARWWGPAGFRNTFDEFDFRPGGHWRFVMHGPDGADYRNRSVFVETAQPRIVVDHVSGPKFRLTVTLDAAATGGTRVGWTQTFPSAAERDRIATFAVAANEQNLDRLEAELARRDT